MSTWKVGGFLPPWRWANEAISIMKSDEILMFDWLILVERMSNPLWIEIINELTKPVNKPWSPFVKPLINYGFMVCLNQFSFDACSLHPVTETGLELWVSIVELVTSSYPLAIKHGWKILVLCLIKFNMIISSFRCPLIWNFPLFNAHWFGISHLRQEVLRALQQPGDSEVARACECC